LEIEMTDQKLIRLIEDNGLTLHGDIEHFAALVAAAEREACAKVCDDWPNGRDDVYLIGVAIRARGEK
jgi:hypothetical protein